MSDTIVIVSLSETSTLCDCWTGRTRKISTLVLSTTRSMGILQLKSGVLPDNIGSPVVMRVGTDSRPSTAANVPCTRVCHCISSTCQVTFFNVEHIPRPFPHFKLKHAKAFQNVHKKRKTAKALYRHNRPNKNVPSATYPFRRSYEILL